jgi:hypothetical protein
MQLGMNLTSVSIAQTYTDDSLAVIAILKANGVDTIYVCKGDVGLPDSSCYQPICVESLAIARNGRIVSLNLLGQLFGSLRPPMLVSEIGHITELESLNLESDGLDSLPNELSQLNNLKWLNLSGNVFTRFPEVVCDIPKLEYLNLDFSDFSVLPFSISKMTNLKSFSIGGNDKLTTIPPQIGDLKNLNFLNLAGSLLQNLPQEIGRLKQMLHLRLFNCNLNSLPDSIINLNHTYFYCDVYGNSLCDPSAPIKAWLDRYSDIDWRKNQKNCPQTAIRSTFIHKPYFLEVISPITIFDLHGRKVQTIVNWKGIFRSNLSRGAYILMYKNAGLVKTERMVIGR